MLYPVKIEFKEWPSGSWADWSHLLHDPPSISKKVESENEGEAGLIVFDDCPVTFRNESLVDDAFNDDDYLTDVQRYLFRISNVRKGLYANNFNIVTHLGDIIVTEDGDFVGANYVGLQTTQLYEGMADFGTLEWPEIAKLITFNILDKLSALDVLQTTTLRGNSLNLLYDRNVDTDVDHISITTGAGDSDNSSHHKWFSMQYMDDTLIKSTDFFNTPYVGEVIQSPYDVNSLSFVIFKGKKVGEESSTDPMYIDVITNDTTYPDLSGNQKTINNLFFYLLYIYGEDLLVTTYRTDYKVYYRDAGSELEIALAAGYEAIAFNGVKLIEALVKSIWPEVTLIKKPSNLSFNIPLDYYLQLIDENPFGKTPLEALKMLANSMKCYVYFNKDGNLVIQERKESSLGSSGVTRTIGNTKIIEPFKRKFFWDKIVDGVTVDVRSWKLDSYGDALVGTATVSKQLNESGQIKPKNPISKEILWDQNISKIVVSTTNPTPDFLGQIGKDSLGNIYKAIALSGTMWLVITDDLEILDAVALTEATEYLNFYGRRRSSYEGVLVLDENTETWELVDNITIDGKVCFFTKVDIDPYEKTVSLEAIEVTGHDYDRRQIVITPSE